MGSYVNPDEGSGLRGSPKLNLRARKENSERHESGKPILKYSPN